MALLMSLIHTGTRVGGLRERAHQAFESGLPAFPADYPGTAVGDDEAERRAKEEQEKWKKKPQAKRASWEKLGTRSPWKGDWGVVCDLEEAPLPPPGAEDEGEELVPAQREQVDSGMEVDDTIPTSAQLAKAKASVWLLRGSDVPSIVDALVASNFPSTLLGEINRLRPSRFSLPPLPVSTAEAAEELYKGALVQVRLRMCTRGAPGDMAHIYRMGDEELGRWVKVLAKSNPLDDGDRPEEMEVPFALTFPTILR